MTHQTEAGRITGIGWVVDLDEFEDVPKICAHVISETSFQRFGSFIAIEKRSLVNHRVVLACVGVCFDKSAGPGAPISRSAAAASADGTSYVPSLAQTVSASPLAWSSRN
jgi:hypothetical protein